MVFHCRLSDSKSPQVSRTFLSILDNFKIALVWMVSTRPLISKSCSPCTDLLVTVPNELTTMGITTTFTFHSFLILLQGQGTYLSFVSLQFYLVVCRNYSVLLFFWYHCHLHVPELLWLSRNVQIFIHLFTFFWFYSVASQDGKVHYSAGSLFFVVD